MASSAPASAPATSATATSAAGNPLLTAGVFPAFDRIQAGDVVPGMQELLGQLSAELAALESRVAPTWQGLVEPLERINDRLAVTWGAVTHLKSVKDSEELRKAVEEIQPEVVKFSLKMGQSKPLYEAFEAINKGELWGTLSDAQKRVVEAELASARESGVALEGSEKERFSEIQQETAELSRKFSNNVLDATKQFQRLCTDPEEVKGLPATALSLAAQQALDKGHEGATPEKGPWLLTLDFPCFQPVMQHCVNRGVREEVYRAYVTRASEGDLDNSNLILRMLELRGERARLLGYANHAEGVMVRRMATLDSALQLIEDIREAAWEPCVQELEALKAFAREKGAAEAEDMRNWDVGFWAERMREAKYELTEEELRPYFSLPNVLDGLFALTSKLFGVEISPADGEAPVWHADVKFFKVRDASEAGEVEGTEGPVIANFYLDPYSRPAEKQGGAWMDPLITRSKRLALPGHTARLEGEGARLEGEGARLEGEGARLEGEGARLEGEGARLPVAVLVCNQMVPVNDKPSLMTFREVETLFHEFGHGLQHMLTVQDESSVSGISNIEWDAVELPSQFMENWCYHKDTLLGMAKHYETGETLPEDLFQKILAARTYRAASMAMRQLHFASIDLELHAKFDPQGPESVLEANSRIAQRMLVVPPLPEDRFLCSFQHIFAGGYAAGYYGYKWAEVLSADAFSAFEESGLDNTEAVAATGKRFRETVLALGGGKGAKDVFEEFRGRGPSIEPLLRHNGLLIPASS